MGCDDLDLTRLTNIDCGFVNNVMNNLVAFDELMEAVFG
jgi:hypothetical protein